MSIFHMTRAVSRPTLPAANPVIQAAVRSRNTTGTGLVSGGFPLQKGQVTPAMVNARQVAVYVNNVEVAARVVALNGRFSDGTLRSVLIQFDYNIPDIVSDISAYVVFGQTRSLTDPALQQVNSTVMLARRVIVPTDLTHLCNSYATFQPLVPDAQLTGMNADMYGSFMTGKFNSIKNVDLTAGNYQSTYESSRGLIARYCMGGSHEYYDQGVQRAYYLLTGYSLSSLSFTSITPHPNESGLPGVNANGTPAEWHSQRYLNFACAYLFTGLAEFWNVICLYGCSTMSPITSQGLANGGALGWISGTYVGRFNIRAAWCAAMAITMDATKLYNNPGGWGTGRRPNYLVEIPWILAAWETHRYQTSDFRTGLRGNRSTSTNGGGLIAGRLPHFQIALLMDFLLFWYMNVEQNSQIPGWIKTVVDLVWDNQIRTLQSGDSGFGFGPTYGLPYMLTSTIAQRSDVEPDGTIWGTTPWDMAMWTASIAFCKAYFGDSKYQGHLDIARDTTNVASNHLTWSWKIFGEIYGNTMGTPYFDQVGVPSGLPQTMVTPINY